MITDTDRLYIRDASDEDLREELSYTRDEEYANAIMSEQSRRTREDLARRLNDIRDIQSA